MHTEAEILEIEPEWPKTGSPAYKNIRAAAQAARERVCLVTPTRIFCLYFYGAMIHAKRPVTHQSNRNGIHFP